MANIDATKGPISKNILKMALPVMLANLMQVIYNLADTFFVGKLDNSTEAIAAVTVSFTVVFVLVSLAAGLGVAASTLAAQYYGAKKNQMVESLLYTAFIVIGAFAVLVVITGLTFNESILNILNTPKNVLPYAKEYFKIIMFGMLFMFYSFLGGAILRGIGDTITPMKIDVIAIALNIVLDPLLIFGIGPFPELGIAGAAYATAFSRLVSSIYLTYFLFKKNPYFDLKLKHFKVNWHIAKKMVKLGIPSASTQVLLSLGGMALVWRINGFGDIAAAAHGIGNRLDSLIFMPAMGLNQAAAISVGQNIGAGHKERAKSSGDFSLMLVFVLLFIIGSLLFIFPTAFIKLFTKDQEVIELGKSYIRFLSIGYPFIGLRIVMNGIFQGAGDAILVMILTIVSLWVFRIPMALLISLTSLEVKGVWLGIGLSFIVSSLFMLIWYFKGKWLNKNLVNNPN